MFALVATGGTSALGDDASRKFQALQDREKTFLRIVSAGDEAKAVEYAQVAGINPNSLGGEPLSVWFYRGTYVPGPYWRNLNVQRIVFERFRQNPNPAFPEKSQLGSFCNHAPIPTDPRLESYGTPEQQRQVRAIQTEARHRHVDAMAAGFDSLLRYGLRDKRLINDIFIGCYFSNAAGMNEYTYDTLISRLLKAGADIKTRNPAGRRPASPAVQELNGAVLERLIRDGAEVNFTVPMNCRAPGNMTNLYSFLFAHVPPRNPQAVLRVVAALAGAGLSPYTKIGYVTMSGYGGCQYKSFYDAVVDSGNIEFAKAIKETVDKLPPKTNAGATPTAVTAALAPVALLAQRVGYWQVSSGGDGRPLAIGTPVPGMDAWLKELRIECVAGGRLEYVPVPAKPEQVQVLLIDGSGDDNNTPPDIKLTNGRASGPAAVQLSKIFLSTEAEMAKQAAQSEWSVGLVPNDWNRAGAMVQGRGFSQARKLLLDNCKN